MYKSINSLGPPTGENGTGLSKSVLLLKERATGGGGGGAKFQIFFEVLGVPDIFGGDGRC